MNIVQVNSDKFIKELYSKEHFTGFIVKSSNFDVADTIKLVNKLLKKNKVFVVKTKYEIRDCFTFTHKNEFYVIFPYVLHIPLNITKIYNIDFKSQKAISIEEFIFNELKDV